ncbi:MAG: hypothetical protein PWQ96_1945 [Clostridia bacterium]|jgi:YebC/PmpR family DNA-binding regulatory protein|nr:hypothetical protein [Clostridiales bacterium]MDK2986301.1 hypothetical protein [Clostridia bacterium]
MAGHSKWANIKHRKAKADAKKGKVFTKLAKEIMVAAKNGGGDPDSNIRLKSAIQKAKDENMPNDNIERAIKKGTGDIEGVNYEEVTYEGYGPDGVAIYLNILTDNRNRTAGEIRHIFSKNGGNLGESGCVAWMFEKKGYISLEMENCPLDEETLMLTAIEANAEDVSVEDGTAEIITSPEEYENVRNALISQGVENFSVVEITMLPQNTVTLNDEKTASQMLRLMDALEEHDDVQAVYANYEIPDEVMEKIE